MYAILAGLTCTGNKWANCRSWQFSKSFPSQNSPYFRCRVWKTKSW